MEFLRIILLGRTGVGKSTLVNSIFNDKTMARTGVGESVTKEIQKYRNKAKFDSDEYDIEIYDTVGFEISPERTSKTIQDVDELLKDNSITDNTIIWFCINALTNRVTEYEFSLLSKLSYDNRVPFIILLTQCYENEESEIENDIRNIAHEIPIKRVLAEDVDLRGYRIAAFGVPEAVRFSVDNYKQMKTDNLKQAIERLQNVLQERRSEMERKAKLCVRRYSEMAAKVAVVPGVCIPIVHGMAAKMILDISTIFGLKFSSKVHGEHFTNAVVGAVVTPIMAVPLFSTFMAGAYIETIGDSYIKALCNVWIGNMYSKDEAEMVRKIEEELGGSKPDGC